MSKPILLIIYTKCFARLLDISLRLPISSCPSAEFWLESILVLTLLRCVIILCCF